MIEKDPLIPCINAKIYTWNLSWVKPFESPWSILEKFRYANSAQSSDIYQIFGNENARKKSYNWGKAERNLFTLEGLEKSILKSILGVDLKEKFFQDLENIIGILPEINFKNMLELTHGMKLFLRTNNLTFCSDCMKIGYHSNLHQLKLLDRCPFHNTLLQFQCVVCHNEIPYILDDKWSMSPFTCKCGHSFISKDNFKTLTSLWKEALPTIEDVKLLEWLSLKEEKKIRLKKIYYDQEIAEKHANSLISMLLSILNDTYKDNSGIWLCP